MVEFLRITCGQGAARYQVVGYSFWGSDMTTLGVRPAKLETRWLEKWLVKEASAARQLTTVPN